MGIAETGGLDKSQPSLNRGPSMLPRVVVIVIATLAATSHIANAETHCER
jgi:hypothetical protein